MYARMKVVYENDKSFVMEVCALDKDEFYTQLLTTFENAKCKYNPDDWGQFGIKHVELPRGQILGLLRMGERQTINKIDDSVIDDRFRSLFARYIIDGIRAWRERRKNERVHHSL